MTHFEPAGDDAPPRHGGDLGNACARYGLPRGAWLDLSTGINPQGYPVPPVPAELWRRLPDDSDDLVDIAAAYYGVATDTVVPLAGSQAAIRAVPSLLPRGTVAIAPLTYSEYAPAFRRAGHRVLTLAIDEIERHLPELTHCVIVNPNNPTAERLPRERLLRWHAALASRGGMLLVDEAFAELTPADSMAPWVGQPGLMVLRSIGKFFGLAGLRAGFALAEPRMAGRLSAALGAWAVGGPTRHVVRHALRDTVWQAQARERLRNSGEHLASLLAQQAWPVRNAGLFCWVPHADAAHIHDRLARQGVWTRLFDTPAAEPGIRFGLPGDASQWARLVKALATLPSP